jgi:hypothetical protein
MIAYDGVTRIAARGSTGHLALTTRDELLVAALTASVEVASEALASDSHRVADVSSTRWWTRLPDDLCLRKLALGTGAVAAR